MRLCNAVVCSVCEDGSRGLGVGGKGELALGEEGDHKGRPYGDGFASAGEWAAREPPLRDGMSLESGNTPISIFPHRGGRGEEGSFPMKGEEGGLDSGFRRNDDVGRGGRGEEGIRWAPAFAGARGGSGSKRGSTPISIFSHRGGRGEEEDGFRLSPE